MRYIYRHPVLYNFLDSLGSLFLADRVRSKALASLGSGSLLEIGVGSGKNMRLMASAFRVGVDNSLDMLEFTRRKFGDVRLVAGDAVRLPVKDASFDLAVFCYVLRGLASPAEAVREALRVSARVVIVDYDRPGFIPRLVWSGVISRIGGALYGSRDLDFASIEKLGASKEVFRYYGGLFRVVILAAH
ncbi:MAG: methyltransferase domain-containing protein [bacterium]|jgi:demethylmenaquinone methyltransferase/2-methoxy-6-polyprenyl-1,4-benzoquinol methylase